MSTYSSEVVEILGALGFTSATPITLLIDGPSGAGKTTLAAELAQAWPTHRSVAVLHMDQIYPGWQGLDAASIAVAVTVMPARAEGREFAVTSWDWTQSKPGERLTFVPGTDLIIEGCGALSRESALDATASVWLDADEEVRKDRALSRGDEDFEAHWDEWDQQYTQFVIRENPQALASLTVGAKR